MDKVNTRIEHVIFDFDGVIVDTFNFHLNNINKLYNIGLTADEYRDAHNGNFYDNILSKFTGVDFTVYATTVCKDEAKLPIADDTTLVLNELSKVYKLHIVTSACQSQVISYLENHDIKQLFATILCAEDSRSKKDKFERVLKEQETVPEKCIYITDTLGDLMEANEVDFETIAVTFGFHDLQRLFKGNPKHIAKSWKEIREILM